MWTGGEQFPARQKLLTKDSGELGGQFTVHNFCTLLRFLSVLIFKHKSQTKRSSVIAHLIVYDCQPFCNQTFDFV